MFVITAPFRSGLLRLAHPFVAATVIGPSQLVVKFKMRSARRIFGRLRGACAQCNARGQGGCPSTRLGKKESLTCPGRAGASALPLSRRLDSAVSLSEEA